MRRCVRGVVYFFPRAPLSDLPRTPLRWSKRLRGSRGKKLFCEAGGRSNKGWRQGLAATRPYGASRQWQACFWLMPCWHSIPFFQRDEMFKGPIKSGIRWRKGKKVFGKCRYILLVYYLLKYILPTFRYSILSIENFVRLMYEYLHYSRTNGRIVLEMKGCDEG